MTKAEALGLMQGLAKGAGGELAEAARVAAAAIRRSMKSTRAAKKAAIAKRKEARCERE